MSRHQLQSELERRPHAARIGATLARQALALNPFDPQVHQHLATALGHLGDSDGVKHEQRVMQILADHLGR